MGGAQVVDRGTCDCQLTGPLAELGRRPSERPQLTVDDLQPELRGEAPPVDSLLLDEGRPPHNEIEALERRRLVEAWQRHDGNRGKMAAELGISRSTLYRRLRQHERV